MTLPGPPAFSFFFFARGRESVKSRRRKGFDWPVEAQGCIWTSRHPGELTARKGAATQRHTCGSPWEMMSAGSQVQRAEAAKRLVLPYGRVRLWKHTARKMMRLPSLWNRLLTIFFIFFLNLINHSRVFFSQLLGQSEGRRVPVQGHHFDLGNRVQYRPGVTTTSKCHVQDHLQAGRQENNTFLTRQHCTLLITGWRRRHKVTGSSGSDQTVPYVHCKLFTFPRQWQCTRRPRLIKFFLFISILR